MVHGIFLNEFHLFEQRRYIFGIKKTERFCEFHKLTQFIRNNLNPVGGFCIAFGQCSSIMYECGSKLLVENTASNWTSFVFESLLLDRGTVVLGRQFCNGVLLRFIRTRPILYYTILLYTSNSIFSVRFFSVNFSYDVQQQKCEH